MTTVGIVSPGAMGSGLGRSWLAGGARVVCTVDGRSARTQRLAAGLEWLPDLVAVVRASDVIVSVGPPQAAPELAAVIADACRRAGVTPLVADVNAVAPSTMTSVAAELARAGCDVVDGAISGPPPRTDGSSRTTLYLSGPSAAVVAGLAGPGLSAVVVGGELGSASAVKMCTASMYKGFTGLLLQALRTAQANGVLDYVLADLSPAFPQVADAAAQIASAVAKSDRFPAEMREIARTQADAGGRGALFLALADVYEAANDTALAAHTPEQAAARTDLTAVLSELEQSRSCVPDQAVEPAEPEQPAPPAAETGAGPRPARS